MKCHDENKYQDMPDEWICEPCQDGDCEDCLDPVSCYCPQCNE